MGVFCYFNFERRAMECLFDEFVYRLSGREQKYEEGIALLRNTLANQSDCVLHRMLGDFLFAVNEYQESIDQYSIALR